LLALVLLIVPAFALLSRQPASGGTRAPWPAANADMRGLEHFARISVERGERLAREFEARQRAEEDLQLSRTQLGHSLEERIRLGRDLHDNISQTLYGLSLTLESTLKRLDPAAPPEVRQRLELSVQELRRLNQEVRKFIRELEPGQVQRQPMAAALDALVATLPVDSGLRLDRKIDEDVLGRVPPERSAEIVNILREAISNSLRHGGATALTLYAQRSDNAVVFGVQDDGRGFNPAAAGDGGHGLANMRARAEALGGELRVISAPAKGTRILLTLPVASPA
jgi:signal transduction histidine kinase